MNSWKDKEKGPICSCGNPTCILFDEDRPMLLCLFHRQAEGSMWYLPMEKPDNWLNLSNQEMFDLIKKGEKEYDQSQSTRETE